MKTNHISFKIFAAVFIYFLLLNSLQAQIISNIGGGFGVFWGEPSNVTIETEEDCIVVNSFSCTNDLHSSGTYLSGIKTTQTFPNRSFDIQFANLSFEPRLSILDSIANSFSLSLGMPLNVSASLHSRIGNKSLEYYEKFDMTFQGALIAYLNFGNGSSYKNPYTSKHGFSFGGGMIYSHSGIFRNELDDLNPPPNDLIKPVLSLGYRILSENYVLSEFNLLIRPSKAQFFEDQYLNECCQIRSRNSIKKEFGFLFQFKLFFGQGEIE